MGQIQSCHYIWTIELILFMKTKDAQKTAIFEKKRLYVNLIASIL